MRSILTVEDVSDRDVDSILARAGELHAGRHRDTRDTAPRRRSLGLIFFEPSLRTRTGFAVAAARLGWGTVEVCAPRHSAVSMAESWSDTLRALAGYCDAIVARLGRPMCRDELAGALSVCAVINGGDAGPGAQHPSQALIDLFAMRQLAGPVAGLRVAIVGDPRMRAVRSLLALLARTPPAAVAIVADAEHRCDVAIPPSLVERVSPRAWSDLHEIDVVYIAGIPHGALPLDRREALLATAARVRALPARCVLLSPMPVVDEMDAGARQDPRNRIFEQSDLGLFVRMAILEHVVAGQP